MRRLVPAVLAAVLLHASAAAAQEDPRATLASLHEMVLYARYDEAITASRAFLDRPELTAAQRNEGLELLATAQLANRRTDDARATLTQLYRRDPAHRLSDADASPTVQSAFARAREAATEPMQIELRNDTPATLARHEAPEVVVQVTAGADAVAELRVGYRTAGESHYVRVVMAVRPDGSARARLPILDASGRTERIEWFVEALAPSLTVLHRIGSEAEPLTLLVPAAGEGGGPVAAPSSPSVLESPTENPPGAPAPAPAGDGGVLASPWFWVITGAVLIAAGVTVFVLAGPPSEGPAPGSLGTVTLR